MMMAQEQPKFWGSWSGKVISVLILHGDESVSFSNLVDETGLHPKGLKMALAPLYQSNVIHYDGKGYRLVNEEIKKEWKKFLETNISKQTNPQLNAQEIKQVPQQASSKKNVGLFERITQWRDMRNLSFPMESKHFFLEGEYLDELARVLIGQANELILVTAPYVDSCNLTNALSNAVKKGIKVKVVARQPENTPKDDTKRKCQAELKNAGMTIHFDNQIHAKIIVIDGKIAIVSSMNLYSASSGGFTKEAGIVSIDEKVVGSVAKYILDLLEKPESMRRRY